MGCCVAQSAKVWLLVLAQAVISASWYWAPCQALCSVLESACSLPHPLPFPCWAHALSFSLSLSNKCEKSEKKKVHIHVHNATAGQRLSLMCFLRAAFTGIPVSTEHLSTVFTHWYAGECWLPERDGKVEGRGKKRRKEEKEEGGKERRKEGKRKAPIISIC